MSCWTSPCLRGFRTFPNTWSVISSWSRHVLVQVQSKFKSRNVTESVVFSFSKTEAKIGTKRDTSKHASIAKCPSLSSCSNQFENFILLKYLVTKLEYCAISGNCVIFGFITVIKFGPNCLCHWAGTGALERKIRKCRSYSNNYNPNVEKYFVI